MGEGDRAGQAREAGPAELRLCNLIAQNPADAEGGFQEGSGEGTNRAGNGTVGDCLLRTVQEPDAGHRKAIRNDSSDAGKRSIPRLLSGDDLRGLFGRSHPGYAAVLDDEVLQIPARSATAGISRRSEREGVMSSNGPRLRRLRLDAASYDRLRREVRCRDGWRCQACGTMSNLEVHHKEFCSHSGDDSELNLITLCKQYHAGLAPRILISHDGEP
jgi:hypothetical protein